MGLGQLVANPSLRIKKALVVPVLGRVSPGDQGDGLTGPPPCS